MPGPRITRLARGVGAIGLLSVGALHAAWAAGSSFPAASRRQLAETVVGSPAMPGLVPTVVVAAGTTAAGIVVAGAFGGAPAAVWTRRLAGLALISRGAVGGANACRALGLPEPGDTFRRLDSMYYRPLCVTLGAAVLGAARQDGLTG